MPVAECSGAQMNRAYWLRTRRPVLAITPCSQGARPLHIARPSATRSAAIPESGFKWWTTPARKRSLSKWRSPNSCRAARLWGHSPSAGKRESWPSPHGRGRRDDGGPGVGEGAADRRAGGDLVRLSRGRDRRLGGAFVRFANTGKGSRLTNARRPGFTSGGRRLADTGRRGGR